MMTMLTRMILALMLGLLILPTFAQDDIAQLRMKADQGNVIAQQQLGFLYSFGQGIPQDYKESANSTGETREKAVEYRDLVAKQMTREQIANDHRLARTANPWIVGKCRVNLFFGCATFLTFIY